MTPLSKPSTLNLKPEANGSMVASLEFCTATRLRVAVFGGPVLVGLRI